MKDIAGDGDATIGNGGSSLALDVKKGPSALGSNTNAPVSVKTTFFIVAPHVEKEEAVGKNDTTGRLLVAVTVVIDKRRSNQKFSLLVQRIAQDQQSMKLH